MSLSVFVATTEGLVTCEREGDHWRETSRALDDHHITSVIARDTRVLAGATDGIFRSDDAGQSWEPASRGLKTCHVRSLAFHPEVSDLEFAGTEPAAIFVSQKGAEMWRECPEVAQLREQHGWYLPYSPEAGCVRGFAFFGTRAYAAVEQGGVLRSDDGGETWRLVPGNPANPDLAGRAGGMIHPDVHSVVGHPIYPDWVYAATGGGFFRSIDGGERWECMYNCYCRAAWVDPDDPTHIILGPAAGVDRDGRIEVSQDEGQTWELAASEMVMPWPQHMVEQFLPAGDELLAVLSNGHLLAAPQKMLRWRPVLPEIDNATAMAAA